jgi:multicomponent Na+:H+ antiporter subunit E
VTPTLRVPALVIWLTLVWALLWGDFSVGSLLAGLAIALFVVWVGRPTDTHATQIVSFHPVSALVFLGYFSWQLVRSNLHVAWAVVNPRSIIHRAIVSVPMHIDSAGITTVVANAVTLTPGTLTVDVHDIEGDDLAPVIYVHVLQFTDAETVRADVLRLERLVVRAFGTKEQRAEMQRIVADLAGAEAS